jgi:hypothetical protein
MPACPPWYSYGSAGIVSRASSVSRETTPSVSRRSTAAANRATSSSSRGELVAGARSRPLRGRALVEGLARPLECPFDRGFAAVEHLGDLGGAKAEYVAEPCAARCVAATAGALP